MAYGHGKIILLGEHAVVHGYPALAKHVPYGAQVDAVPTNVPVTTLRIAPWGVQIETSDAPNPAHAKLQQALKIARNFYSDEVEFDLHVQITVPGGANMGSSAALGVAVLRALDEGRGFTPFDPEIFERSRAWERVFHGDPSGIDSAMAIYGGMALFRRGREPVSDRMTQIVPRHEGEPRLIAAHSATRLLRREWSDP